MVRVGFGTDSHRFEKEFSKPLLLGGIKISDSGGLSANSDGDVILHALFNAISQACGGHSLGYYADPLFKKGITDSKEYLKIAAKMVNDIGYRINNVGIMVEAKKPVIKIETVEQMKDAISQILDVSPSDIGITFTSGEGLTSFGRGDGILAQAIVSIVKA